MPPPSPSPSSAGAFGPCAFLCLLPLLPPAGGSGSPCRWGLVRGAHQAPEAKTSPPILQGESRPLSQAAAEDQSARTQFSPPPQSPVHTPRRASGCDAYTGSERLQMALAGRAPSHLGTVGQGRHRPVTATSYREHRVSAGAFMMIMSDRSTPPKPSPSAAPPVGNVHPSILPCFWHC